MIDEIEVLQRFRANVPPADDQSLLRARAALVHHATHHSRARHWSRGISRHRIALGAGLAVVIALIAVVGVTLPRPAPASAAEVLDKAATAAAATPDPPTRPGQFTYLETLLTYSLKTSVPDHYEQRWIPVDSSTWAGGLIRGRNGKEPPFILDFRNKTPEQLRPPNSPPPPPPSLETPTYDYLQTLPTDPNALRKIVYEQANPPGRPGPVSNCSDRQAFLLVLMLAQYNVIPPTLWAGLFRVIATMPGATVVDDIVDGARRHGIGVSWPLCGQDDRATLIFDKKTHKVLGDQVITYHGTTVITTTIFRSGLVDQIDQIP